jgi:hypothetical protein
MDVHGVRCCDTRSESLLPYQSASYSGLGIHYTIFMDRLSASTVEKSPRIA